MELTNIEHLNQKNENVLRENVLNVDNIDIEKQTNLSKAKQTDTIFIKLSFRKTYEYKWEVRKTLTSFKGFLYLVQHEIAKKKISVVQNTKSLINSVSQVNYNNKEKIGSSIKNYLNDILLCPELSECTPLLEYFEISIHSFALYNQGVKPKEGYIMKQSEYTTCQKTWIDIASWIKFCCCTPFVKSWFLLKNDMMCYLTSSTSEKGKDTLWFDSESTIIKEGRFLILRNSSRKYLLKFEHNFQRDEWYLMISEKIECYKKSIKPNPYNSFVNAKCDNKAMWFIDGKNYFADLHKRLLKAKETVYITDWWMSPELFLMRPVDITHYIGLKQYEPIVNKDGEELIRLCDVLNHIAKKGVKVYILLYCEFSLALTLDSKHTKNFLSSLDSNIIVTRHPKKAFDLLWSHHEKLVVIDQKTAYVGGLDLCWGRYDTQKHLLYDHENREGVYEFPGIDYSNARISDFYGVSKYLKESVDRYHPRMPWHDIHSMIRGPAVLDISRHFVERWNSARSSENKVGIAEIKTDVEKSNESEIRKIHQNLKFSSTPKGINKMKCSFDFLSRGDHLHFSKTEADLQKEMKEEKKNNKKKELEGDKMVELKDIISENPNEGSTVNELNNNTAIRKGSVDNETNSLNNNKEEKRETEELEEDVKFDEEKNFDAVKTTFKRSSTHCPEAKFSEPTKLMQAFSKMMHIKKKIISKFSGKQKLTIDDYVNLKTYRVKFKEGEPRFTIQCVRSLSNWSGNLRKTESSFLEAYYSLIDNAEHYIYIENQFFISKSFTEEEYIKKGKPVSNLIINEIALHIRDRIVKAHKNMEKFKVYIFIPLLPGFEGEIDESSTLQVILKFTYRTISRNKGLSLIERLYDLIGDSYSDYIGFYSLRQHGVVNNIPVTELIYIHSKLMLVDDKYMILGSANINDRSMCGNRDSEFGVIYKEQDEYLVPSVMNGKEFKASFFVKCLRMKLWTEHLGIREEDVDLVNQIIDPLDDDFDESVKRIAKKNTEIYREVFNCYPDDLMKTFKDVPKRRENLDGFEVESLVGRYNRHKDEIKGHIVELPLNFLENQLLERSFFSAEMLVPIKNFV